MLGPSIYEQILKDNNFFLNNLTTIPVNLEYEAWYAVIDPTQQSETKPVSLHDHLLRQPWFLHLESAGRKKCIIITSCSNLQEARKWIDEHLQRLICISIPQGIDPPDLSLLCRLDKPIQTATSQTYAEILKKQFSLVNTTNDTTTANATTQPARKWQASLIDYDLDNSAYYPPLMVNQAATTSKNTGNTTITQTENQSAVLSIKNKLNQLKEAITLAVAQIQEAVAALLMAKANTSPQHATTDPDQLMGHASEDATLTHLDLQSFITDLKHELATVFMETRAMLQHQAPAPMNFDSTPSKT